MNRRALLFGLAAAPLARLAPTAAAAPAARWDTTHGLRTGDVFTIAGKTDPETGALKRFTVMSDPQRVYNYWRSRAAEAVEQPPS